MNLRTTVTAALALGAAWLAFEMFEPLLTWSAGWHELPKSSRDEPIAEYADAAWHDTAAAASTRLREAHAKLDVPAISAAVSIDGKRVWAGAIGYAEVESGTRVALDSRFRLGSTSKAVTSVAIGTLLDANAIDLDQPASRYVADLAQPLARITTRQALSHTGGVRDYGFCACFPAWEHLNTRHFDSVRAALDVFEHDALRFAPGTGFAYTSFGFNLAGAVLEVAASTPYLDYVQHKVFAPLGMTHSGGDVAGTPMRVAFYEVEDGRYKRAFEVDNSIRLPSGGIVSTPSDMLALGNAIARDGLLSPATRTRLTTPQPLADGSANPQGYALGWRVADDKKLFDGKVLTRIVSHHGTAVGSTSYFAVLPEYGIVISVMMNKSQQGVEALAPHATALAELFVAEVRNGRSKDI